MSTATTAWATRTATYRAAHAAANAAGLVFAAAQADHRARRIGDAELFAAGDAFRAAGVAYDAALSAVIR